MNNWSISAAHPLHSLLLQLCIVCSLLIKSSIFNVFTDVGVPLSYLLLNHSTSSCHALVDVTRKQVIKKFVHLGMLMSSTRVSESMHQVCNIINIKAYQAYNISIGYASLSMHHHHSLFIIEYQGSITSLFTCTYCTIIII